MNVNDTEIAWGILQQNGFTKASNIYEVMFYCPSSTKKNISLKLTLNKIKVLEKLIMIFVHCFYQADAVLVVTCAIREGAEEKIWSRLRYFKNIKLRRSRDHPLKIGILGDKTHIRLFKKSFSFTFNQLM